MRILTVVTDLGLGGTQRVAQNLTLGMRQRGAEVALLAHRRGGPREAPLRAADVPIFTIAGERTLADAIRAAEAWRPDVIHIHRAGRPDAGETAILRHLRSTGAKVVETNVFARFDWTEGGSLIDAHCQLSQWCAFKWHAWAGSAARGKLSVVLPNAVDVNAIRPLASDTRTALRRQLGIAPQRFLFGRIGQPIESKWDRDIFRVFQEVLDAGHDVGLFLVGAPASYAGHVASLSPDVRARIVMQPVTSDDRELENHLGVLDGFLHLARIGESFGMALCEAMLAGIPVVTLSTPLRDNSQLEVVGHRKGGLVALDPAAVPQAMIELIGDRAVRDRVRTTGRDWVSSRFGMDVVTDRLSEIYQMVLGARPSLRVDVGVNRPPSRDWIEATLREGIGTGLSPAQRAQFELIHTPLGYRAYFELRKLFRR